MNCRGQAQRQALAELNASARPKIAAPGKAEVKAEASTEASRRPPVAMALGPGCSEAPPPSPVSTARAVSPSELLGPGAECKAVAEHRRAARVVVAREPVRARSDGSRARELREKHSGAEPVVPPALEQSLAPEAALVEHTEYASSEQASPSLGQARPVLPAAPGVVAWPGQSEVAQSLRELLWELGFGWAPALSVQAHRPGERPECQVPQWPREKGPDGTLHRVRRRLCQRPVLAATFPDGTPPPCAASHWL
jgi:hypothetical protein